MKPAPPVTKIRFPCRDIVGHSSLRPCRATSRPGSTQPPERTRSSSSARGGSPCGARPSPGRASTRSRSSATATLSRASLLRQLVASEEFERVALLDGALSFAAAERARPREVRGPARPRELRAPAWSDERALEIPWCLARYDGERRVLDVGYAFAEAAYVAGLAGLGAEELVGRRPRRGAGARAAVGGRRRARAPVRGRAVRADRLHLDARARRPRQRGLRRGGRRATSAATRRPCVSCTASSPATAACSSASRRASPRTRAGRCSARRRSGSSCFEGAGFLVFEDELYVRGEDGWRTATLAEARGRRLGEGGPGAGAVLLAELRPAGIGERAAASRARSPPP